MELLNGIALILGMGFVILLPFYIRQENRKDFKKATALKLTLSGLFVLIGFLGAFCARSLPAWLLTLGLAFSFPGDYFLQFIKKDMGRYQIGICCFAATQVCSIAAYILLAGIGWIEFVILGGLLLLALILMLAQKWDMGAARPHLTVYTVLLGFMCAKALLLWQSAAVSLPAAILLGLGGLAFFLSDLVLGIWCYRTEKMAHADLNWLLYFPAQLFIALGIGFL